MKKTNEEIINLFKSLGSDEKVWVKLRWNYYLHCDEENHDVSIISLDLTGQIYKLFREVEYEKTDKEIIDLFKECPGDDGPFSRLRYGYYIYYDEENKDTSIISTDPAGRIYKLFREREIGEDLNI